jgi:hypothetical protein
MPDTEEYLGILTRLDAALDQLRGIIVAHQDCPGCRLCRDCKGMVDSLDVFLDVRFRDLNIPAKHLGPAH